jgi:steroid delta-isomerase-like uncharacterized protein
MSEANKALVRSVYEEVFDNHRLDLVRELYCEDCVLSDPSLKRELHGLDELIALLDAYKKAYPVHNYTIHEMIAEGDKVAVRWSVKAERHGRNGPLNSEGISMCTVHNGKTHMIRQQWDDLGALQQLGVIPSHVSLGAALAGASA